MKVVHLNKKEKDNHYERRTTNETTDKDIELVYCFYVHRLFFDRHHIQIQSVQGEEYVDKGESVESALKICETGCDSEGREMLCCLLWEI